VVLNRSAENKKETAEHKKKLATCTIYSIELNRRFTLLEEAKIYFAPKTDTGKLKNQRKNRANQTAKLMNECLDMNEVRDLCLDLQVDFENILGERKIDKIKALVGLFYRQNLLDVLINWLHGIRPDVDWPENHISAVD
jgi:hypothetical protein